MYIVEAFRLLIYKYQDIPGRYLHKSTSLYYVSIHTHTHIILSYIDPMNRAMCSFNLRPAPPLSYHRILPPKHPETPAEINRSDLLFCCLFPRQRKLISPAVGNVLLPVIRWEGSPMKHIVKNVDILNPQSGSPDEMRF